MITSPIQPSIADSLRPSINDTRFAVLRHAKFSAAASDYLTRLQANGVRLYGEYDAALAQLIDRLNGGIGIPADAAYVPMAGFSFPGTAANQLEGLLPAHDKGTIFGAVTGDWNAKTGLKGDAALIYADSNRGGTTDPQNDFAMGAYCTLLPTSGSQLLGNGGADAGSNSLATSGSRNRSATAGTVTSLTTGYIGNSRNAAADYLLRYNGSNSTITQASEGPRDRTYTTHGVAAGSATTPNFFSNARLNFYHAGPNLNSAGDLAEMDAALAEFDTALQAI